MGDSDPYLQVFSDEIVLPGSAQVSATGSLRLTGQVPAIRQVLITDPSLTSTCRYLPLAAI